MKVRSSVRRICEHCKLIKRRGVIRVICSECKQEDPNPDRRTLKLLGFTPEELEGETIYKGAGCKRCSGSGYRGRVGAFEMLLMNSELRDLAFNRATASQLRAAARASGMKTILEDGKGKILSGVTTPEDLLRVTQAEGVNQADCFDFVTCALPARHIYCRLGPWMSSHRHLWSSGMSEPGWPPHRFMGWVVRNGRFRRFGKTLDRQAIPAYPASCIGKYLFLTPNSAV